MMKTKARRSIPLRLALLHVILTIVVLVLLIIILVVTTRGFFDLDLQAAKLRRLNDGQSVDQLESPAVVCSSPECVQLSGEILARMDPSVDPCEDFYEFACRGFIRSPLVPTESSKWGTTSVMDKTNKFLVKQMLEQPMHGDSTSDALIKAKKMYAACMAVTLDAGPRLQSIFKMIEDIGSWPMDTPGSSWSEDNWRLETALASVRKNYAHVAFMVYVSEDDRNNSINRLIVTSFFPDASFYNGSRAEENHAAFSSVILRIVQLLGGSEESARASLDDLWHLDKALADIKLTLLEYRADVRKRYNLMSLQGLQRLIGPGLNISLFLDELYGEHIPLTETVIVRVPSMFSELGKILQGATKRTLATYITLQALWENSPSASTQFRDAIEDFKASLAGGKNHVPRWQRCVADSVAALGFAVGALFTKDHFVTKDKSEVVQLLENIRQSFLDSIPSLTWMDEMTKASAVAKAIKVSHKVGFPDFIQNKQKLDDYYSDLTITDDDFLNHAAAFERGSRQNLRKRGREVDQDEWSQHTSPTVVNAFYDPQKNAMIFPAGILQKPIYHNAYPRALSYGAVGTIMGHELTHGFDTTGRRYDPQGNLFNWWGNVSTIEFEHRTRCLVDQYNQYEMEGIKMDGLLTLEENIADNGGLRLSYRAYQEWKSQHNDPTLVGLNMEPDQMFFLGQAQTLCTAIKPSFVAHLVRNDVHSPAKFRVIGTMQNMEQFSEAFNCPKGSPMNPENKCLIWT